MSSVITFPLSQVMDWREQNRRRAEINRINGEIRGHEAKIAEHAHKIWLLKLERSRYEDNGRG